MKKTILRLSMFKNLIGRLTLFRLFCMSLLMASVIVAEAQVTIKGKVTDETGTPMPGVNVVLKSTTIGTTTDANGGYTLNLPSAAEGAVLIFSFIGYETLEQSLEGRTSIDVSLAPGLEIIDEIVVVGYGVQKKSDVTGALVQVNEKALRDIPASNLANILQGRAAGIQIDRTSSRPGAGMQIRIRGSRSLGSPNGDSNDPLFVVDGIPYNGSINDINPDEIASIEVLKDASATAIYGSRGSNGVIMVTTKRGKQGRTQLTYDGYYGVNSVIEKYKVYNGQEYADFRILSGYNNTGPGTPPGFTADEQQNYADGKQTDWQDLMYKKGYITNHSIGVNGGTENTQYSISAGAFKETTALPGQAFTRYSLRATVDQKIGERIKIGINSLNSVNITDGENASPMFQIITLSPLYNAYNADGTIYELPATGSIDNLTRNPLLIYDNTLWKQERKRLRTFNSLYGEVKIVEGLKYRANIGLEYFTDNFGQFNGSNTPFLNGGVNNSSMRNENAWSYTVENLLLYEKTLAEKHKLNFTGLFSVQEFESSNTQYNMQDIVADPLQFYNPSLANTFQSATGGYTRWGLLSYMGRVNYNFNDRYLLTVSARGDGSSRLAEGNKWFYYPAAALAWNVHNESFMEGVNFLSNLKLRFGYGKTSNQAVNPYSSLGSLNRVPYNFGQTGLFGLVVNTVPNADLTWEFTTTTNLGVDFGLFSNRVTGSVELYQNKTTDILQNRTLPITAGIPGAFVQNIGKTESKGLEVTLSTVNVESESDNGFSWSTDFNFFLNREKVIELAGGIQSDINNGWFVGSPIDAIFDYNKIGIWQNGTDAEATAFDASRAGFIKVEDVDGDGVATAADRKILGSGQASWQGGITNRIEYKGFDFSFVIFARVGGMLVSTLHQSNPGNPINSLEGRRNGPKVDYWTPENPTDAFPLPGSLGNTNRYGSTIGYFDATFMKIRTISLGYKLPTTVLSRSGINSVRIYVTANNPFKAFFSPYVDAGGLDPEPTGRGGAVQQGWGQRLTVGANTPLTRAIIFGLNIKY